MSKFKTYRKYPTMVEARPYVPGEDLSDVSVSTVDMPGKKGDMIARNPDNHADQWLIGKDYWDKHYDPYPIDP